MVFAMNDLSNDIIKIAYLTSMSEIVAYIFISNLKYKKFIFSLYNKNKKKIVLSIIIIISRFI